MDVAEAVHQRRALRAFDANKRIEDDKVLALINAMRLAPSCNNNQPYRVIVVRSPGTLAKVREALTKGNVWATAAPMVMAVCAKPSEDCRNNDGRDYYLFDSGIAIGEMVLQATELGMIAHCIGGFDPLKVKEALDIPADYVLITLMICGYPGTDESLLSDKQKREQRERPERFPIGHSFFAERWGDPYLE